MKLTDRNIVNAIAKKMQDTLIARFGQGWEELDRIIAGENFDDPRLGVAVVKLFEDNQPDIHTMAYVIDCYFEGRNITNDTYNAVIEMLKDE